MSKATTITVLVSVGLHVGLATGLVAVAKNRELKRRAISVAVQDEKKPKPQTKPPAPPKPIARPAPAKVAPVAKEAPAPAAVAKVAAAPVAMNLAMSNAGLDVGPGIGLQGRAQPTAAAPVKTASAVSERRTNRTKEEAAAASGGDAPCEEEATLPVPIVKTPIDYTLYPQAQADGIEGKFKARIVVGANGEVTDVEILIHIDPGFDAAIEAALRRWRFKPAMACGKPVAGGSIPFTAKFELGD